MITTPSPNTVIIERDQTSHHHSEAQEEHINDTEMNSNQTQRTELLNHHTIMHRTNGLYIVQWNLNGISALNRNLIQYMINERRPHALMIQEAEVTYQVDPDYQIHFDGYSTISNDGGFGKAITLIRNDVTYQELDIPIEYNNECMHRPSNQNTHKCDTNPLR
eukprot:169579_1